MCACVCVCLHFERVRLLSLLFFFFFISIHSHTHTRTQATAADFVYAEQNVYISESGRDDSKHRMMNVSPVSVRTECDSILCAGILTFACPLLAIHFFLQTWFGVFCLQQHLLFDELCVLCAWFHLIISDFHSSIRIANFESLNWSVWRIPFIQCHHQFFESFTNILLYCSISSAHCKQFCMYENCFAVVFSASNFRFIILPFFYCYFGFGSPKFVGYHLRMSASSDYRIPILYYAMCPCFVRFGRLYAQNNIHNILWVIAAHIFRTPFFGIEIRKKDTGKSFRIADAKLFVTHT